MSNSRKIPHPGLVIAALIAVQVLFGLNYVISKIVVGNFPPLVWASIRIIIAAVVMVIFAKLLKKKHPEVSSKFFGPLVIFSLLGCVINQSSFLVGLKYTTSTNSAILNTLIPVFTLLIVTLRGQEQVTVRRVIGFFFAFGGVLVLRKVEDFHFSDQTAIGDALMILNCFSYGLFLAFGKKFLETFDRLWVTAWLFIYGSFGLTLIAIPSYQTFVMPEMTTTLWGASAFAILGGTLLTYFLNNWALAYAKASQVAIFIYIQPVIAAALAWYWFGEVITIRTVIASLVIFTGVLLVMGGKTQAPVLETRTRRASRT